VLKRILKKLKPKKSPTYIDQLDIKEGEICIDCGANVGIVTKKLADKGANVFSFEPNPYAYKILREKFQKFKDVTIFQKGVGKEEGRFNLYLHEKSQEDQVKWSTGSSFLSGKPNVDSTKSVEVEVVKLSSFINDLDQDIRLLKMDVEGLEYEILDDLINTGVINKIQTVLVETHEHKIPELKEDAQRIRKIIQQKELKNIDLDWV